MYSRNTPGKPRTYIDDEYELYKYNIPPIYDGSRFVSDDDGSGITEEVSDTARDEAVSDEAPREDGSSDLSESRERLFPENGIYISETGGSARTAHIRERKTPLFHMPEIGREELMLLAVIFIISGGECDDDSVLVLVLILLSGIKD